jgi:hypothetical protein
VDAEGAGRSGAVRLQVYDSIRATTRLELSFHRVPMNPEALPIRKTILFSVVHFLENESVMRSTRADASEPARHRPTDADARAAAAQLRSRLQLSGTLHLHYKCFLLFYFISTFHIPFPLRRSSLQIGRGRSTTAMVLCYLLWCHRRRADFPISATASSASGSISGSGSGAIQRQSSAMAFPTDGSAGLDSTAQERNVSSAFV